MRRIFLLCILCVTATATFAQIDDEQAMSIARPFVVRFAEESIDDSLSVERTERPNAPGGPNEDVYVTFGEMLVFLDEMGRFKGFSNMSAAVQEPIREGVDFFDSDDAAWQFLESLLTELSVTGNHVRQRLDTGIDPDRPNVLSLALGMSPYGYEADGGNVIFARIHRVTGRVISLNLGRGWTHEAPNIRRTPEDAISSVRTIFGGQTQDWRAIIKYVSIADPAAPIHTREMRSRREMRLHYMVSSNIGTAYVDSVTGDIVRFIAANQTGSGHVSPSDRDSSASASTEARSPSEGTPSQANAPLVSLPKTVLLVAAVLLGIGLFIRLRQK